MAMTGHMTGHTTDTVIDMTRRLEWEVSKEQFEVCEVGKILFSPAFEVKSESQVSHWRLVIEPKFQLHAGDNNRVLISLALLNGDVTLEVEIEGIGVKTEAGYRPGKPFKDTSGNKMVSKIEHFNGRSSRDDRMCLTDAGLSDDFLKLFNKNKMTVVATLRFYIDRNDYIEKNEREQIFVTEIRTIPDLNMMTDFTIICGGREFACHRVILASRSTVFKAMMLNDHFVENRENSVTIENASPDTVETMLEFISKGVVPPNIEEKAIDLIDLADRYDLKVLIKICESSLVDNLSAESVIETLIAIDLHVPNSQHRQKILDFIKSKAAEVVKSSHWKKFVVKYPDLVTEIFLWAALPPGEAIDN